MASGWRLMDVCLYASCSIFPQLPFQIRKALKEQRDVNLQLRNYIDGILMNIIEQHPELLEVRK